MKNTYYPFLLAAVIALAGCGSDDDKDNYTPPTPPPNETDPQDPKDPQPGDNVTVNFTAAMNAMSRATDTSFENGDLIGVFAVKASEGDKRGIIANSGNYADNVSYRYNGGMLVPTSNGITKEEGTKLFYTAVYPYTSQAGATFDFTVNSDQRSYANHTGSDLCTASTDATDATQVNLNFTHRLSRIVANFTGDGWGSDDMIVSINALPTAQADINDLKFTAKGSKTRLYFSPNGTRSYKVILPPQVFNDGEYFLQVTVNGKTYDIKAQTQISLVSGKSYEYTINMNASAPDVITFTGDINPWNTEDKIDDIIPEDLQDDLEPWITIYKGNSPPNIEGTYFIDPFVTVYCQDQGNGGYDPGTLVNSEYVKFSNQNMTFNTLDISERTANGSSTASGNGAFISGTGNNFSAFFNTVGQSHGISTKTALVISGTKTQNGIANLRYAFVMVEKGSDPNHYLMEEGVFRVFEDQDGLSVKATWPSSAPAKNVKAQGSVVEKCIYSNWR